MWTYLKAKNYAGLRVALAALVLLHSGASRAYILGEGDSDSQLFLNFLELYAANASSASGENASSLVNSVRNNTSIYSTQIVKYDELSSQEKSPLSPGFRYNRKFEDHETDYVRYERATIQK